ncbi:putative soyasaponin III rhamnosyltransferase [Rosa chinensis]|uniref:Putative soyasaponin III rhamnosyltransferase n=1 Tax=Rosa chinensis TaxID=74649 RepID=A0A2P6RQ24_ROSCH|nr:putative soyasaponin III rhamnosyltransferase [Rosa chinensis]
MDVLYHIIPYLKLAHDGLEAGIYEFLEAHTPDWIIHDFSPHWLPPIATKLGISRAYFSILNAAFAKRSRIVEQSDEDKEDKSWTIIVDWLNKQEKGTVVYVALGTEVNPSREDFTELALGLELSGLPFFWVLRKLPSGSGDGNLEIKLPDGFEHRTKGQGLVWRTGHLGPKSWLTSLLAVS